MQPLDLPHLLHVLLAPWCTLGTRCHARDFWQFHAGCPLKGRNKILASICPQIYGLFLVKLAVALTLIGGCARQDDSGTHIRGEVHMLLIGDPGTGKSQVRSCRQHMAAAGQAIELVVG